MLLAEMYLFRLLCFQQYLIDKCLLRIDIFIVSLILNQKMNQENIDPSIRDVQKLRSKSIRIQNPHCGLGFPIKLNSKKFPVDFFGKEEKLSYKVRLLGSQKISRTQNTKIRSGYLDESPRIQTIPEAQITSFFKGCNVQTNQSDTNPSENKNKISETNIQVSQFNCFSSKQISSSVQINEKIQILNDLCCTFSKIPVSLSNIGTPQRKQFLNHNKSGSQRNEKITTFSRLSIKKQNGKRCLSRARKSSLDRIEVKKNEHRQLQNGSARLMQSKHMNLQLLLPRIPKKQK